MARAFDGTQYLRNANAVVAGTPCTLACWFQVPNLDNTDTLVSVDSAWDQRLALMFFGATNDTIGASTYNGGSAGNANTTTTVTAAAWHHACAVFAATNDRRAYLNGGGKDTDTTNIADPTVDQTNIANTDGSYILLGSVAEAIIWNAALTDLEVWLLWRGIPPWRIRRSNLVSLWLPWGVRTDRDFSGRGYHMTPVNGPTWVADPPKLVGLSR